jgi:glycine cleavage system regulatory protein
MAHLAGKFAGILRVEVLPAQVAPLSAALAGLQERGLRVIAEPSEAGEPPAMDQARTMDLELVGLDRPGIVREISQILARSGANVEELSSNRSSAPMSGEMLFSAKTRVRLPAHADVARLRAGLERMASDLMVEIRLVETALEAKGRAR